MKLSPTPTTHPLIKAFFLGTQGEGKSGSTVPLAIKGPIKGCPVPGEGFELCVLDFDGKYEEVARAVLSKMVSDKQITQSQADEALSRIDLCLCREKTGVINKQVGRKMTQKLGVKGSSTAWSTAVKQMEKWQRDASPSHILIPDSLTHAAKTIINFDQELNNRLNEELTWQEYQGPQQRVASFMTFLADFPSHVIVCGHQTVHEIYRRTDRKDDRGNPIEELIDVVTVPVSVGKAGSLELPSQFNHCLVAASEGTGKGANRYIHTKPIKGVTTKTPFFNAKDKYLIQTGWVEYFALRKS